MKPQVRLTGQWVGNYYQHDRPHPIVLDLVQDGDRITGSMRDGDTDRETSVFEMFAEAGLPPGADEQMEATLRQSFPDAPDGPIRYVTHLPSESTVEGSLQGDRVAFLKTYRGASFGGFRMGDRIIGHQIESHSVHYEGRLSADGQEIEGRWWIDPIAGLAPRVEGPFLLRR